MTPEERIKYLENGLKWIGQTAAIHALGGAFDPEHMRLIANCCSDLLSGAVDDLPDFDKTMAEATEEAKRIGRELFDLVE